MNGDYPAGKVRALGTVDAVFYVDMPIKKRELEI